jgi:hypothetical protein
MISQFVLLLTDELAVFALRIIFGLILDNRFKR